MTTKQRFRVTMRITVDPAAMGTLPLTATQLRHLLVTTIYAADDLAGARVVQCVVKRGRGRAHKLSEREAERRLERARQTCFRIKKDRLVRERERVRDRELDRKIRDERKRKPIRLLNIGQLIVDNEWNLRTEDDSPGNAALAESIAREGLLTPVIVKPGKDGKYLLLAGFRRVEALRLIGEKEVKAEVWPKNSSGPELVTVEQLKPRK